MTVSKEKIEEWIATLDEIYAVAEKKKRLKGDNPES